MQRDLDNDIRQYMPEPYRSQKASFIPSEHYDRNLGGTLGQGGAKVEERLKAMDTEVSTPRRRSQPAAWVSAGCAIPSFKWRYAGLTTISSRITARHRRA